MDSRIIIQPQDIRLEQAENSQEALFCTREGSRVKVSPRRLFPFTWPQAFISLVTADEQEVGIIRDLKDLPREVGAFIEGFLDQFYFVPHIREILDLREEYGISQWTVRTDHGRRSFEVRRRSTDIKVVGKTRVLIKDADENMYEIPDWTVLPQRSRVLLEGEI